jgi:alanine racemase
MRSSTARRRRWRGIYGFDPLLGRGPVRLRPALSLKARIAALRDAAPGDAVGYGSTFVCQKPSRLAALAVATAGYPLDARTRAPIGSQTFGSTRRRSAE